VPHGTLDYSEMASLGVQPEDLTLFSSNINPFGPPPAVVAAMRSASPEMIARYPDRLSLELRQLLSAYHDLPANAILVGNGSADLFWLVGLLHLQHRRAAILGPTFGEYRNIANIMQAEVSDICHPGWVATPDGFAPGDRSISEVANDLHQSSPDVVFICNPNNPTGHCLTKDELDTLYYAAPKALWIMDEAYAEFMQPPATTDQWVERGNWLVLRSMTKDFALGGLRLGYLLGAPALVEPLQTTQPPWNVNTFAQLAGCISLHEGQQWRTETLAKLANETATLQQQLRGTGFQPCPTTVNYFLVPVESPPTLRRSLLAQRLVVRDCTSFGLPHHIRIATQLPEANGRLVQALAELTRARPLHSTK
jgi:histidinol-phosphate aminotransferase